MKVDILDKTGKSIEQMDLSDSLFGIKPNDTVLAQYIRVFLFNQRQGTSSTKTRGEVSGGGKKPWRQKGTGRARFGSSRNPIWRHGGVSHGPKPRSWNKTMPKKLRQLALASALSFKSSNKNLTILNELKITKPNTSDLQSILNKLNVLDKRTLIVLDTNNAAVIKSASNIKGVSVAQVDNLNAYEVSLAKNVLFLKDAVTKLHEKYELKTKVSKKAVKKAEKVETKAAKPKKTAKKAAPKKKSTKSSKSSK